MCNTYCFSTVTMVARMCLNITLSLHCQPCFIFCLCLQHAKFSCHVMSCLCEQFWHQPPIHAQLPNLLLSNIPENKLISRMRVNIGLIRAKLNQPNLRTETNALCNCGRWEPWERISQIHEQIYCFEDSVIFRQQTGKTWSVILLKLHVPIQCDWEISHHQTVIS